MTEPVLTPVMWRDRFGHEYAEQAVGERHHVRPKPDRVVGPLERAWSDISARPDLREQALSGPQPQIQPDLSDPADSDPAKSAPAKSGPATSIWTWTVSAPNARAVLLWTNPFFDHEDVRRNELTRLPDSDLWTISLRMPDDLRASYRIAMWEQDGTPPWRTAQGRRPRTLAAMAHAASDPRAADAVLGSNGQISSVAAGPDAPQQLWTTRFAGGADQRCQQIQLDSGDTMWVYQPRDTTDPTPLLVLFDGNVWHLMLPAILDELIENGVLPPLHVAMLDARDPEYRTNHLGVPTGQVDVVLDDLLPTLRAGWNVRSGGVDTIVAGQSFGGISALWTVALGEGQVGHAIAQSPSLWRFDVAEALLRDARWRSIELQGGAFEGQMANNVQALADTLRRDPRSQGRSVHFSRFSAGHDSAAWRVNLINALVQLLSAERKI